MEYDERVAQEWGSLYGKAYLESTKYVCSCIDKMECNCQEGEDE